MYIEVSVYDHSDDSREHQQVGVLPVCRVVNKRAQVHVVAGYQKLKNVPGGNFVALVGRVRAALG